MKEELRSRLVDIAADTKQLLSSGVDIEATVRLHKEQTEFYKSKIEELEIEKSFYRDKLYEKLGYKEVAQTEPQNEVTQSPIRGFVSIEKLRIQREAEARAKRRKLDAEKAAAAANAAGVQSAKP